MEEYLVRRDIKFDPEYMKIYKLNKIHVHIMKIIFKLLINSYGIADLYTLPSNKSF